ncbi:hypothetical protein BASA82_001247 [Batrachochytrium salamandrivorans]|nr:hypothetical protein BASA82_001247 [Batrachochytrium salamandrivorans]
MTGQSSSGSTSQDSTDDQSSSGPTSQGPLTDKEQEKMQESFVILSGKTNKLRESIQSQREEISALKTLVKQLKGMREGKTSSACDNINAEIAEIKEKIAGLKEQLEETETEYRTGLYFYSRVLMATREKNFSFVRQYLWDHQDQ